MSASNWDAFRRHYCRIPSLGLSLDVSRMGFPDGFIDGMRPKMEAAFKAMAELEGGAVANPDEGRMVGHYWLRDSSLAPTPEIREEIDSALAMIKEFATNAIEGGVLQDFINIGIGGSALGPMFVADALGSLEKDELAPHFIDNTDPDGVARQLAGILDLEEVLVIVTSKSGGTPETYNGMTLVRAAYAEADVDFAKHAVAITMPGSKLDKLAESEGWLARFPMFDWVGGRTSELSAVGLLPAALQGVDISAMLDGARLCDQATRNATVEENPAALLALSWYHATGGKAQKDMVVLPYKDRLLLFSRYLQQLVMESLGKRLDLDGNVVEQGLSVYGNKGSTDQHAYVQQLRDGANNFFAVFIRVLEEGGAGVLVGDSVTAGDFLNGFLLGTREALSGNDRQSLTITVPSVTAQTVGALIALFERAVGLYASLVNINAYHQPGVEAGKKAAASVLTLQEKVLTTLSESAQTAEQIATSAGIAAETETVFLLLEHLAANGRAKVVAEGNPGDMTFAKA